MRTYPSILVKLGAGLLFCASCLLAAPAFSAQSSTTASSKPAATSAAKRAPAKSRIVRRRRTRQRAQTAPTPQRISEIQAALAAQGTYKGEPNGKWDAATTQAMKDFQSAHGLTATGKLDALSLQKLGLGSEIAGRAAPLALSPSSTSTASSQQQSP